MADVAMPRLSDSMEEGTILKWLKSDGDEVSRGEELVEIETDKATMTYEADEAGSLSIVAGEGDTLPVGELIARIGADRAGDGAGGEEQRDGAGGEGGGEDDDEPAGEEQVAVETAAGGDAEPVSAAGAGSGDGDGGGDGRVKASPVTRRMARDMGVELGALRGTGPGGRIVKADVEAAAQGDEGAADGAAGRAGADEAAEPPPEPAVA